MKPKLVIFDMDGTVLDTLEDLRAAMNTALARFGYPACTPQQMKSYVGNGLRMMAVRALPPDTDDARIDEVYACFKSCYAANLNTYTHPYEGICGLLTRLKAEGIATAIVSNKFDPGAKALAAHHFGDLIDFTQGESDDVPRKPDPTGTKRILERFHADRTNARYVGDSAVDIRTAEAAGLDCVCVTWGFQTECQLLDAGAKRLVSSVRELETVLLN